MYDLDKVVTSVNKVLTVCGEEAAPKRARRARKAKLRTWSPEIKTAISEKKKTFYVWKSAGKPQDINNPLLIDKKRATKVLRRLCRKENANQYIKDKQEIMDAKTQSTALFHKLVNKHRGKLGACVNELHVDGSTFKTETDILEGWRQHFGNLASASTNPLFDQKYEKLVDQELLEIIDICERSKGVYDQVTEQEIVEALSTMNKGKAADIYGVTTEHLLYAIDELLPKLVVLINGIFQVGTLPDSLKIGLLTPVFKKKGSSHDAKNYRGITITPIISKLLESLLRERIKPYIDATQNKMQRGFTKNSSPMNCSLILEEYIRENKDHKRDIYVAYLDAKSAFDVVHHSSLLRRLFHIGIEGVTWNLIHSLHKDAQTVIRWCGQTSDPFEIQQGVRQGGVLSTDMYKVYVDPLLSRVTESLLGGTIGEICCAAPTCADDMTFVSDAKQTLQTLIHEAADFASMERYLIQPVKSVVMPIASRASRFSEPDAFTWSINGEAMPVVEEAAHMGILRSSISNETTVNENIKKARRTLYSLMAPGLHGYNGLDPETSVQLFQIYVLPALVYGLEVILPEQRLVDTLERSQKKFLKHILSLPTTTADPAVYILTGTIPVEGVIHKRALSLFGNICRLDDTAIEKQLAKRQLTVKNFSSKSWFIAIKKILLKYDLPDPLDLLGDPLSKYSWKRRVNQCINSFWTKFIK
ncbi:MAG: reverse transcriptase family protein, partial [Candidatus Thiodiazotropha sp.]